jgi:hypothetical protein
MKIDKSVLIINLVLFVLAGIFIAQSRYEPAVFGMAALAIAFLNILLVIGFSISGNRNAMLNALIVVAVLVTVGFSVCSRS